MAASDPAIISLLVDLSTRNSFGNSRKAAPLSDPRPLLETGLSQGPALNDAVVSVCGNNLDNAIDSASSDGSDGNIPSSRPENDRNRVSLRVRAAVLESRLTDMTVQAHQTHEEPLIALKELKERVLRTHEEFLSLAERISQLVARAQRIKSQLDQPHQLATIYNDTTEDRTMQVAPLRLQHKSQPHLRH